MSSLDSRRDKARLPDAMKEGKRIKRILRRDGSHTNYQRGRITDAVYKATTSAGSPNKKLAETVSRKVEAILVATYDSNDAIPSVEDIQDIVENTLMESGYTAITRSYIIYRHQRAQLRSARSQPFEMSDIIPYRKIYEVLLWNMNHRCDSISAINKIIRDGFFPDLVAQTEERYEQEVQQVAELMGERTKELRAVIVAGPSSSGKTTTTIKLSKCVDKLGIRFKPINIDNYFFDLDKHPKDEFGDHDYETPQALDLKLINQHFAALLDGKTVLTPSYDFKAGKRTLNANEFTLKSDEILLIDSLHGLHKDMTRAIPHAQKFRLYIETLGQIRCGDGAFMRWADNRLLRRMIRDQQHRNLAPLQTLTHWHYVRTGELSHIIPFINTADAVVNTALPYEIPILRHRLMSFFPKAMKKFQDDPKRRDAYIRAKRVYELLQPLKSVSDDSCVPATSLLREFIGGSRYRY